uniref:Putative secreted protein n=1 Tax=Ixodes ricinus TaxID=34613 RepID=A0A6B0UKX6_IXORI
MAWLAGVLRSRMRLSRRVSWFTLMFSPSGSSSFSGLAASSTWSGRRGSAALTTNNCSMCSSTSCCVQPSTFCGEDRTMPYTSSKDSFVTKAQNLTIALLTFSDTATRHCTVYCC